MESTNSDLPLIECLEEYLLLHGEGSMLEIASPYPHLQEWAKEHDTLGWDNFLEGRIGSSLFTLQRKSLREHHSRLHIKTWATMFIQQVLAITHQQWSFRNARVHIRLLEGKTTEEHQAIMDEVLDRLSTPADVLLPQHRYLVELDFACLGEGTSLDRQYWLATLDSAVSAAAHSRTQQGQHTGIQGARRTDVITDMDLT
jgi:hypothetical protein